MKNADIRKLDTKEVEKKLAHERHALRQARFDVSGTKVKNVKAISDMRKNVARILTEHSVRTSQSESR